MTEDYQEIDGIGPAREEKLNNEGYETYAELGEADHEELAENINRLSEDAALDLVVQAQNLADLEEAEVEEEPEVEEDEGEEVGPEEALEELPDDEELEEEEAESEDEGETTFDVVMNFDGEYEYDTFYHTLIEERCNLRRTNRTGVESYEKMMESMRAIDVDGQFTVEMTGDELNDLHNAVMEQRHDYQGENLIDYMDALRSVEDSVNEVRREFLF
jgi:predicted RecB family nuclease